MLSLRRKKVQICDTVFLLEQRTFSKSKFNKQMSEITELLSSASLYPQL